MIKYAMHVQYIVSHFLVFINKIYQTYQILSYNIKRLYQHCKHITLQGLHYHVLISRKTLLALNTILCDICKFILYKLQYL